MKVESLKKLTKGYNNNLFNLLVTLFFELSLFQSKFDRDRRKVYSVYKVVMQINFFEITPTGMYQMFSKSYLL